jgi:glycosyltransferase involved in cell wall biosynthesis
MNVSVMMPCYNSQRFVAQALASLCAQSRPIQQMVVVDDGSSDDSRELLEQLGQPVLACPHRGISASLNEAARASTGEWLAWIDADDLWHPDKLEWQTQSLLEHPEWAGVFVGVEQFREDGAALEEAPGGRLRGALLLRRAAWEQVGCFDESLPTGEFIDWMARAQSQGLHFGDLPQIGYRRRLHDRNTTLQRHPGADYLRLIRAKLQRERRPSA